MKHFSFRPIVVAFFALTLLGGCARSQNASATHGSAESVQAVSLGRVELAQLQNSLRPLGIEPRFAVQLYRLEYQTLDIRDRPVTASGLVIVPDSPAKALPWISLQHGTIAKKTEAPSVSPNEGLAEASQGFLTVLPDYLGYGSSSALFHPYIIEASYGRSLIDMLRASRLFAQEKGLTTGPLFLKGYSEGGYATLALQKAIERDAADEFPIAAVAAAAGPYDVPRVADILLRKPRVHPLNLGFILLSYEHWLAPGQLPLGDIFLPEPSVVAEYLGGQYSSQDILASLPQDTNEFFEASFVSDFLSVTPQLSGSIRLHELLADQDLTRGDWTPKAPLRLYHCIDDEQVPVEASDSAFARFEADGARVSLVRIPSPNPQSPYKHGNCPAIFSPLQWFGELLAGASTPSSNGAM